MATIVLVHGAWHGGWCWRRVAVRLRAAGHEVFTPTMTGLGERAHLLSPEVGLDTHITDIVSVIEVEELEDVVLAGHSYGGLVITGVADRVSERLKALVYVDAYVPKDGEGMLDLSLPARRDTILALAREQGDGWRVPPTLAEVFGVRDPADRAWVDRRCTDHPLKALTEPISLAGAGDRVGDRTFVWAAGYSPSGFTNYADRFRADPAWRFHELPCGHEIMIDMPDALTGIIRDVVGKGSANG